MRLARIGTAPDLWLAWVDPNQLELAILNLALNARDAMANGGSTGYRARTGQHMPAMRQETSPQAIT